MFTGLLIEDINANWHELCELLKKPLEKTEATQYYTPEHVLWKCIDEKWQCWAAVTDQIDCVFITYVTTYPTGYKTFTIYLVGGSKIDTWLEEAWNTFKSFAKHHHCGELVGMGRKGWIKTLKKVESNELDEKFTFSVRIE